MEGLGEEHTDEHDHRNGQEEVPVDPILSDRFLLSLGLAYLVVEEVNKNESEDSDYSHNRALFQRIHEPPFQRFRNYS